MVRVAVPVITLPKGKHRDYDQQRPETELVTVAFGGRSHLDILAEGAGRLFFKMALNVLGTRVISRWRSLLRFLLSTRLSLWSRSRHEQLA